MRDTLQLHAIVDYYEALLQSAVYKYWETVLLLKRLLFWRFAQDEASPLRSLDFI